VLDALDAVAELAGGLCEVVFEVVVGLTFESDSAKPSGTGRQSGLTGLALNEQPRDPQGDADGEEAGPEPERLE
jgi:hypothetical protein